jgi:cytidine deaminase
VAAAVLTADGRHHTGINIFHFSGGPCAEIVALGRAATDTESSPVTLVAVGNGTRGIVTPCGRCRQMLHDIWPEIQIIIARANRTIKVALSELLPEP